VRHVPNFKYTKDYSNPGVVWDEGTFEKIHTKSPRHVVAAIALANKLEWLGP
jgi:hypothetical protein